MPNKQCRKTNIYLIALKLLKPKCLNLKCLAGIKMEYCLVSLATLIVFPVSFIFALNKSEKYLRYILVDMTGFNGIIPTITISFLFACLSTAGVILVLF